MLTGAIAAALAASSAVAVADEGHGDIEVEVKGDKLVTEGRVFEAVFGDSGIPFFTDDPGFEGDAGVFTIGTTIGFNIMAALGLWNGKGFDDLNPLDQETLTISFGPASATTDTGFVNGFDFVSDASNGFDVHLGFTLNRSGGFDPADGIYLLALQLTSNNYLASETFWIVFDNNIGDEKLDQAVAWVEANLVPAPGALALLGLAGLFGTRRRKA
jgi:hypothetical protein